MLEDIESSFIVNGFASPFFKVTRGCCHGDPILPYVFILLSEILAILIGINNYDNITGSKIGNTNTP